MSLTVLSLQLNGTAAALVRIHISFNSGINDKSGIYYIYGKLRTRLDVLITVVDEVSMLSCHDMYHISAQPAKALMNQINHWWPGI